MVREFEEQERKKKSIVQADAKKSIAKRDEMPKGTKKLKRGGGKSRGTRTSSNRNRMKIESPSSDNEEREKNSLNSQFEGEEYMASIHNTPEEEEEEEEPFHR